MAKIEFPWPAIEGGVPVWTGRGFALAGRDTPVLDYEAGASGWNEDLTRLHEAAAGEGTHPIDVASRRRARSALAHHLGGAAAPVILEAGCSSGFLLEELVADWPGALVVGSDFIPGPLYRLAAKRPDIPLLRFDLVHCPLPSASVDAVVLLNVLEHIEDHEAAVRQVARILRPGGVAVIEVPAGPGLYDAYDRYLQHFRRYRLRELCSILEGAGLTVRARSHLGFLLYPAFAFVKRRNQRWLNAPEHEQRRVVEQSIGQSSDSALLRVTTAVEEAFGRWIRYPVGIRCVAVAQRSR
jgi:SAM-dependent methyltransferase